MGGPVMTQSFEAITGSRAVPFDLGGPWEQKELSSSPQAMGVMCALVNWIVKRIKLNGLMIAGPTGAGQIQISVLYDLSGCAI
jgi:hypothetical protein